MYGITVTEEEWRADPDCWLAEDDRWGETTMESEYPSSESGAEDSELMSSEIQGDGDVDSDEDPLQEEGDLNFEKATAGVQLVRDEENGLVMGLGLSAGSNYGLKKGFGPNVSDTIVQEIEGLGPKTDSGKPEIQNGTTAGEINNNKHLGIRDSREKKRKAIKDCYPKVQKTKCVAESQGTTGRTKLRAHQIHEVQHVGVTQEQRAGSSSLSDGCIVN
ncbi:hypothetical protein SLA2020_228710 [Shorea laevis]